MPRLLRLLSPLLLAAPLAGCTVVGPPGGEIGTARGPEPAPSAPAMAAPAADVEARDGSHAAVLITTRNGDRNDPNCLIHWWTPRRNTDAQAMASLKKVTEPMLRAGIRRLGLVLPGGSPAGQGTGKKHDGRMTASQVLSMSPTRRALLAAYIDETKRQYPGLEWWIYVGWGTDANPNTARWEKPFGPDSTSWFPDIRDPDDVENILRMYRPARDVGFDRIMIDAMLNQDRDAPASFGSSDEWTELIERETGLDVIAESVPLERVPRDERLGRGDKVWRIDLEKTGTADYFCLMRFADRYGLQAPPDREVFVGISNQWDRWKAAASTNERVQVVREHVLEKGFTPVFYISKGTAEESMRKIVELMDVRAR